MWKDGGQQISQLFRANTTLKEKQLLQLQDFGLGKNKK